jgi:hypothetical protein
MAPIFTRRPAKRWAQKEALKKDEVHGISEFSAGTKVGSGYRRRRRSEGTSIVPHLAEALAK